MTTDLFQAPPNPKLPSTSSTVGIAMPRAAQTRRPRPMIVVDSHLAWDLADQLNAHLNDDERTAVFVDLGSGDDVAAIHRLFRIGAKLGHSLSTRTATQFYVWAYAHDAQDRYALVLARIEAAFPLHVAIVAGVV